jgi:uncharacterized protein
MPLPIQLHLHDDETTFAAAVTGFLEAREAENALLLGMLAGAKPDPPAPKAWLVEGTAGGETVFAACYRGINFILSRGPDAAVEATAEKLAAVGADLPGVIGPAGEAERFALAWARARGCGQSLAVDQRIYQLTEVTRPEGVPGKMRPVGPADLDLIATWAQAFDECLPPRERRTLEQARDKMAERTSAGNLFAWEVEGYLVSMAGLARPTARTIAVNSVYTPPAQRRRGFATALVAAVSGEGLQRGKERCVLYTDLTNPTSNSIYQKVGYRPVSDSRNYHFHPR